MQTLIISLATALLGVVVTILVSRYYFLRSVDKDITAYVQFSSAPLGKIHPKVRSDLKILYQNHPIENLYEIQFLIANTGEKAIRDIIRPLTLSLPEKAELLDASMLHISPTGRDVSLKSKDDGREISFEIPLLNKGEFFIFKLLLNGDVSANDFEFTITADDLSPVFRPKPLPGDSIGTFQKTNNSGVAHFGLLVASIIFLSMGVSSVITIATFWQRNPNFDIYHPLSFFAGFEWINFALLLTMIPSVISFLFGVMMMMVFFLEGLPFLRSRKKFVVPDGDELLTRGQLIFSHAEERRGFVFHI